MTGILINKGRIMYDDVIDVCVCVCVFAQPRIQKNREREREREREPRENIYIPLGEISLIFVIFLSFCFVVRDRASEREREDTKKHSRTSTT